MLHFREHTISWNSLLKSFPMFRTFYFPPEILLCTMYIIQCRKNQSSSSSFCLVNLQTMTAAIFNGEVLTRVKRNKVVLRTFVLVQISQRCNSLTCFPVNTPQFDTSANWKIWKIGRKWRNFFYHTSYSLYRPFRQYKQLSNMWPLSVDNVTQDECPTLPHFPLLHFNIIFFDYSFCNFYDPFGVGVRHIHRHIYWRLLQWTPSKKKSDLQKD